MEAEHRKLAEEIRQEVERLREATARILQHNQDLEHHALEQIELAYIHLQLAREMLEEAQGDQDASP